MARKTNTRDYGKSVPRFWFGGIVPSERQQDFNEIARDQNDPRNIKEDAKILRPRDWIDPDMEITPGNERGYLDAPAKPMKPPPEDDEETES